MVNILETVDALANKWIDWRLKRSLKNDEHWKIVSTSLDEQTTQIVLAHPAIAILAEQAANILSESQAENYVQFDMRPRNKNWIRVTVQWANGISPAAKAAKLSEEVDQLRDSLVACMMLADDHTRNHNERLALIASRAHKTLYPELHKGKTE